MLNVDKGAAWLDEFMPDWYTRIDLDRLNMANDTTDILGQLGMSGVTSFQWEANHGHNYSFEYSELTREEIQTVYAAMTVLWKEQILKRRRK